MTGFQLQKYECNGHSSDHAPIYTCQIVQRRVRWRILFLIQVNFEFFGDVLAAVAVVVFDP